MENFVTTTLDNTGRIYIPTDFRQALEMEPGTDILIVKLDNELKILTRKQAIKQAQDLVSEYIDLTGKLVDEFIDHRRLEATRE